jgi:hypothetical protein
MKCSDANEMSVQMKYSANSFYIVTQTLRFMWWCQKRCCSRLCALEKERKKTMQCIIAWKPRTTKNSQLLLKQGACVRDQCVGAVGGAAKRLHALLHGERRRARGFGSVLFSARWTEHQQDVVSSCKNVFVCCVSIRVLVCTCAWGCGV